jgi:hypothetical protein
MSVPCGFTAQSSEAVLIPKVASSDSRLNLSKANGTLQTNSLESKRCDIKVTKFTMRLVKLKMLRLLKMSKQL